MDAGFSASSEDGRHELRGAWFWSERGRIIGFGSLDFASDPFGRFAGYENTEGGIARGVELAYRVTLPGRTRAQLHYTFTDADPPANAPDELASDWLVPRHQGGALLSGALSERLRWSADLLLSGGIHAPLFDPDTFASRVFRFAGMRRLDVALFVRDGARADAARARPGRVRRRGLPERGLSAAGTGSPGQPGVEPAVGRRSAFLRISDGSFARCAGDAGLKTGAPGLEPVSSTRCGGSGRVRGRRSPTRCRTRRGS